MKMKISFLLLLLFSIPALAQVNIVGNNVTAKGNYLNNNGVLLPSTDVGHHGPGPWVQNSDGSGVNGDLAMFDGFGNIIDGPAANAPVNLVSVNNVTRVVNTIYHLSGTTATNVCYTANDNPPATTYGSGFGLITYYGSTSAAVTAHAFIHEESVHNDMGQLTNCTLIPAGWYYEVVYDTTYVSNPQTANFTNWTEAPFGVGPALPPPGGVASFAASGWPSWLVPVVLNPTTNPTLEVTADPLPNSALQYSAVNINGIPCSLGAPCTLPPTTVSFGTWDSWLVPTLPSPNQIAVTTNLPANSMLAAIAAGPAGPVLFPSCYGSSNALGWQPGVGYVCNTISGANGLSGLTPGQVPVATTSTTATGSVAAQITINSTVCPLGGSCTVSGGGGGSAVQLNSATAQTINQTNSGFGVSVNNSDTTATHESVANLLKVRSTGAGGYNNNGPWYGNVGGLGINLMTNTPSITQGITGNFTCIKLGDCAWMYAYNLFWGGQYFGSDEGQQTTDYHTEQVGYFQGALANPTIGSLAQPYYPGAVGQLYLWNVSSPGVSEYFPGNAPVVTLQVNFGSFTPTAQTGYFVIFTPGSLSTSATITQVIPVAITATSGTQTFTSGTFGSVNASAGQGLGFYLGTGNGPGADNPGTCAAAGGVPTTGTITVATSGCPGFNPQIMASQTPIGLGSQSLAVAGAGCYSHSQGCEGQADFAFVPGSIGLDLQNPTLTSATLLSQTSVLADALTYNVSGGSFSASTAWGNPVSCTPSGPITNSTVATSVTCNVPLTGFSPASPGNFTTGLACMAGGYTDNVMITSAPAPVSGVQTITFNTYQAWIGTTLMMQGGPCGQFIVDQVNLEASNAYWPMAYQVLGAFSTSQIAIANCWVGNCLGDGNSNTPPAPAPIHNTAAPSISRTSNVVSIAPNALNFSSQDFLVGSTLIVSACSVHTDYNGTFTVATNSYDNFNPVLTWSQTGADEGADTTCLFSQPNHIVNFYPGAFIVYSPGLYGVGVGFNNTTWGPGDSFLDSPTTQIALSDETIVHAQSSPGGYSSGKIWENDGPASLLFFESVTDYVPNYHTWAINVRSTHLFDVVNDPTFNGALFELQGNQVYGTNPKPYPFWERTNQLSEWIDPVRNIVQFNRGTFNPLAAPAFQFSEYLTYQSTLHNSTASLNGTACTQTGDYNFVYGNTPEMDGCASDGFWHNLTPGTTNNSVTIVATTFAAGSRTYTSTFTLQGLNANSVVLAGYSGDPSGIAGWGTVAGMTIDCYYVSVNTGQCVVINPTAASITTGTITFNLGLH